MSQAKTLTQAELRQVLGYIATKHKHAARNRTMLLMTHWAGLRVGEVAALKISDVANSDGTVKDEVRLTAQQTKGNHARTVYLGAKIRKELCHYLATINTADKSKPLFYTQKRTGFNANTLTQHFFYLYKSAGVEGGSSHSGRRSYLTGLADKGISIHILKSLAGHRSIATTAKYLYSSPTQLKAAADLAGL
jgi:integrase/recombinase XerD